MAINFPASPSTNDTHTENAITWIFNGTSWDAQGDQVTAASIGLGNVDNTADADKPVSTATQTALDDKQDLLAEGAFVDGDKTKLDGLDGAPGVLSNYSDGDVAVVIVGGQSNAVGVMGTALASASNVHVIGEGERAFIPYTATNSNAYQSSNSFVNPTTALAEIWQSRIDGGASLPDLYIVTVASSGQGLSTQVNTVNGNRWNPNSLKTDGASKWNYPVNGVADSDGSMYETARVCVQAGLEDIVTQGKRPVLLGALWVQGEEDAKNSNSGADYLANFQSVVSMFRSAAANDAIGVYPYKLFSVPAMFANKTDINTAFDVVAADDSRVTVVDASLVASYDAGDASDLGIFNGDGVHLVDVAHEEMIEQFLDLTIDAGAVGVVSSVNHEESAPVELDFSGITHTYYASDFAVVATNSPLPFALRNAGGANGSGFLNERTGDANAWRYVHQNGTISGNFFTRYSDGDLSGSVKLRCEADDRTKYNIAFGMRIQNYVGGVGHYNLGKEIILVQATGLTATDSDTGNATARVWRLGAGLNTVSGNLTTAISNLPAVDTEWFLRCSINGNEIISLEYSTDDVAWTEWLSYDLVNDGGITADVTDGYRSGGGMGLYYGLGSVNGNFDEFKIHEVELR